MVSVCESVCVWWRQTRWISSVNLFIDSAQSDSSPDIPALTSIAELHNISLSHRLILTLILTHRHLVAHFVHCVGKLRQSFASFGMNAVLFHSSQPPPNFSSPTLLTKSFDLLWQSNTAVYDVKWNLISLHKTLGGKNAAYLYWTGWKSESICHTLCSLEQLRCWESENVCKERKKRKALNHNSAYDGIPFGSRHNTWLT